MAFIKKSWRESNNNGASFYTRKAALEPTPRCFGCPLGYKREKEKLGAMGVGCDFAVMG